MQQNEMLAHNIVIMAVATVCALDVLFHHVYWWIAGLSLALNIARRASDFSNTIVVLAAVALVHYAHLS